MSECIFGKRGCPSLNGGISQPGMSRREGNFFSFVEYSYLPQSYKTSTWTGLLKKSKKNRERSCSAKFVLGDCLYIIRQLNLRLDAYKFLLTARVLFLSGLPDRLTRRAGTGVGRIIASVAVPTISSCFKSVS